MADTWPTCASVSHNLVLVHRDRECERLSAHVHSEAKSTITHVLHRLLESTPTGMADSATFMSCCRASSSTSSLGA